MVHGRTEHALTLRARSEDRSGLGWVRGWVGVRVRVWMGESCGSACCYNCTHFSSYYC